MTYPHSPPRSPHIPRPISFPIACPPRMVATTMTTAWASRQVMTLHPSATVHMALRTTAIQHNHHLCPTPGSMIIFPPLGQPRNWQEIAPQSLVSILIPFKRSTVIQRGAKTSHKRPPLVVSTSPQLISSSLTSLIRVPHVDLARYVCESLLRRRTKSAFESPGNNPLSFPG